MSNSAIKYVRESLQNAHGQLEATMADVTETHLHWRPNGTAHPISGTYAHLIISEDMTIAGLIQKKPSLAETSFAGKTGVDVLMPSFSQWSKYSEWANTVRVNLPQLREYAQAVYKTTDEYVATLTPEDLESPVDLSVFEMGQKTVAYLMDRFIIGHCDSICGEIAVLKGLQGLKGYPF